MRWRFMVGIGLTLALAVGSAAGGRPSAPPEEDTVTVQAGNTAKEPATPLIQRVVLLTPPPALASDPIVQRVLIHERTEREKAHRKAGSFVLRLPSTLGKPSAPTAPAPKPSAAPPKTKQAPPGEDVSAAQLQAITDALLADAMREHLHRLKIAVVPDTEVNAALKGLHMALAEALRPEGAEKLRAQLHADAVLTLSPARIEVEERQSRTLVLWVTVRVPTLRTPQHAFPPLTTPEGASREKEPLTPLTEFAVAGFATANHAFLKSTFARTPPSLAQSATEEAAASAVHALRSGSAPAFPLEGALVALVPVASPTQADQLLFAPDGRKVLQGAVRNLPADVSERFRPDFLPLFPEAVRDAGVTRQALQALHLTPAALWAKEQSPARDQVQAVGRRLGVGYVLMARVTDIEVDTGPTPERNEQPFVSSSHRQREDTAPQPQSVGRPPSSPGSVRLAPAPTPPWERQGTAEVVGVLIRVRDGAVLWQDRATATMSSRHKVIGEAEAQAANRQAAEDATRFALLQLQRQFRAYCLQTGR
ncbi:MAG TPA: hypothetical protein VKU00_08660 [Chthonomonadaceae bacterium]|nr:hypothetical protein [Chthonomonadaceae bacterium]